MHNHCTQCVSRALAAGSLLLLLSCTTTILQEYNNDAEKVISGITMSHDDDEDIETGQCVCEGEILWVCVLCEGGILWVVCEVCVQHCGQQYCVGAVCSGMVELSREGRVCTSSSSTSSYCPLLLCPVPCSDGLEVTDLIW